MLAKKHRPPWAQNEVNCTVKTDCSRGEIYQLFGPFGIPVDDPGVALLKQTCEAVKLARKAAGETTSPSLAWTTAAGAFEKLQDLPVAWADQAGEPVVSNQLNLAYVIQRSQEITKACRIASLYHDPSTHVKKDEIKEMALMAKSISSEHVICPQRICSRLNVMEFEDWFAKASELEESYSSGNSSDLSAADLTSQFQTHAAYASLHYNLILSEMVTPKIRTNMESLSDRISKSYADSYPAVLKKTEADFTPLIYS